MTYVFAYLAVAFAAINTVATVLVVRELQKRRIKTNFLLIRLYIFKYLSQYKSVTTEEQGSPGVLYNLWLSSIILMGVCAIAAIITIA